MTKLSTVRKGEEVLLRNGKRKVYGIESVNTKEIVGVRRDDNWVLIQDHGQRNTLAEIFLFFRW